MFIFICSIAFQLSGSLLLLFWYLNNHNEKIIQMCFPGSNVVFIDKNNKALIDKEKLQCSARNIYMNCAAFVDLTIGYLLSVAGFVCEYALIIKLASVLALTALLCSVEYYLCVQLAKSNYKSDITLSYDYLERLGVDSFVTCDEIEKLFNPDEKSK